MFKHLREGKPAQSSRMAIGVLIIKKRYGFSDEDTVEVIRKNPCLQCFLGFAAHTNARPFDPSMMTWFKERITTEMPAEVKACITGRKTMDDQEAPASDGYDDAESSGGGDEPGNQVTFIPEATCCPQNIRFPTDVSLFNEGRELLKGTIDSAHQVGATGGKKPRTYRNLARWDWLRFVRNRKPNRKMIRKALRQQLICQARSGLSGNHPCHQPRCAQRETVGIPGVIRKLHELQQEMYENNTHCVDERIVSLHQPWVRPIERGKTAGRWSLVARWC